MRINEIANAEEQLALWKLVSDNVWSAIQTQAHQQAEEKAVAAQQQKTKRKRKGKGGSFSVPHVPKPMPLKTQNQP
jgi:ribosomal protein L19E